MASFGRWYNLKLAERPIATNMVSAAVLFGLGDVIAQATSSKKEVTYFSFDWKRTSRASIYGSLIFAPLITKYWYPLLNKVTGTSKAQIALKKVLFDQLCFAPTLGVPLYFICIGFMEGKTIDQVKDHLHRNYKPTLLANWSIWPLFQFVNFRYIPYDYRLLAVNTLSIAWNTFLSFMNNR